MATPRKPQENGEKEVKKRRRSPAKTPEAREKQLIALAMDEAERKIRAGTASSQLLCHFLKLGSTREAEEQKLLRMRNENLAAKTEAIHSAARVEELYQNALNAMRKYGGEDVEEDVE